MLDVRRHLIQKLLCICYYAESKELSFILVLRNHFILVRIRVDLDVYSKNTAPPYLPKITITDTNIFTYPRLSSFTEPIT